jgi:hypothetical protein
MGAALASEQKKPLTNQDIVSMVKGGLDDSVILLAIETSPTSFETSPEALIALKKQNVSEAIIRAMLAAAKSSNPASPKSGSRPAAAAQNGIAGFPTFPVDFSAEQFLSLAASGQGTPQGKVFVGKGRLRFEAAAAESPSTTIVDASHLTGYVLVPGKPPQVVPRFEGVRGVVNGGGLSRYLLPVDPQNPCSHWLNVQCKALGSEILEGRSTTKWEVTHSSFDEQSRTSYFWVDMRLHIVSKRQYQQDFVELRNIVEGPQPAALFEVP